MMKSNLKRIVLDLFSTGDLYGYEVKKKLELDGVNVDIGRIYSILYELNSDGLLIDRWEKSETGPRKRVYSLLPRGEEEIRANLNAAIKIVHKHYSNYLMSLYPKIDILGDVVNCLTSDITGKINIGYYTPKSYPITDILLMKFQQKNPDSRLYLVKPRQIDMKIMTENTDVLSGNYADIPLKNDFADILLIVDLPAKELLSSAIKEWHRVLVPRGCLGIITPSVLVKKQVDPIDIGDYVEKHEHEILGMSHYIDGEIVNSVLGEYFDKVDENKIVHMTLFVASKPIKK